MVGTAQASKLKVVGATKKSAKKLTVKKWPMAKNSNGAVDIDSRSISKEVLFECSICLECPIITKDIATISGCSHQFCFDCIDRWAKVKNTCPLCKVTFESINSEGTEKKVQTRSYNNVNGATVDDERMQALRTASRTARDSYVLGLLRHQEQLIEQLSTQIMHLASQTISGSVDVRQVTPALQARTPNQVYGSSQGEHMRAILTRQEQLIELLRARVQRQRSIDLAWRLTSYMSQGTPVVAVRTNRQAGDTSPGEETARHELLMLQDQLIAELRAAIRRIIP